jgi:predicted  nucleic acid-binding Zn-ribbon protein
MSFRWFFRNKKAATMKENIKGLEEAVAGTREQATEAEDRFKASLEEAQRRMIAGALVWRGRRNGQ